MIAANLQAGIQFTGTATNNAVEGDYIGVNSLGAVTAGLGNPIGVYINNTRCNSVGGTAIGAGNIIAQGTLASSLSSSLVGVEIQGPPGASGDNSVLGNLIGIDKNQTAGDDSVGVLVTNSSGNFIGGPSPGARNIISANQLAGIEISGDLSINNNVAGNYIGTNFTGTDRPGSPDIPDPQPKLLPSQESGIFLDGVSNNIIGGASFNDPGANLISGNIFGIQIAGTSAAQSKSAPLGGGNAIRGNLIGTNATGMGAVPNIQLGIYVVNSPGNVISGNLVSGNGIAGVELFNGQSTGNSISSNIIGGNASGQASFISTSSTVSFVTPSGITVSYGLQEHGVVVIGASNNTIGSGGGNQIVGNIDTGVYLANRDFAGNVYAAPVNDAVENNSIRTNGIYGVLLYNSPNNPVPTTGSTRNVFSGDPITIEYYISAVNSQSPLPPPKSTLLPTAPTSSGTSSSSPTGSGSTTTTSTGSKTHGKKPVRTKHPAAPKKSATPARPRVPALFSAGAQLKLVAHKPSGPQVRTR